MRRPDLTGEHWNTEKLRREREYGWFRQHEPELIEAARQRRKLLEEAAQKRRAAEAAAALEGARRRPCPACGAQMRPHTISGTQADRCPACEGIFLDKNELELLLLKHDEQRWWFFRTIPYGSKR
ncbi:MAG: zf-TFIIB domain-containing protein [Thermoanaerobaculia bacterium]